MQTFPCLVQGDTSFAFQRALGMLLAPLVCVLASGAYYGACSLRRAPPLAPPAAAAAEADAADADAAELAPVPPVRARHKFIAASVVLIFLLYPTLVKETLQLFTCINLEPGLWVMRSNPGVECWSAGTEHAKWVLATGVPSLVLWCVGIPLGASMAMLYYYRRDMLQESAIERCWGFLYKGYEDLRWEAGYRPRGALRYKGTPL